MENGPYIDVFPIKTSIYEGFSMAMLNNQRVHLPIAATGGSSWVLSRLASRESWVPAWTMADPKYEYGSSADH